MKCLDSFDGENIYKLSTGKKIRVFLDETELIDNPRGFVFKYEPIDHDFELTKAEIKEFSKYIMSDLQSVMESYSAGLFPKFINPIQ